MNHFYIQLLILAWIGIGAFSEVFGCWFYEPKIEFCPDSLNEKLYIKTTYASFFGPLVLIGLIMLILYDFIDTRPY